LLRDAFAPTTRDQLHRYLEVDTATYLPNDILTKVDITSMMNSLEVRVPLLDHKLAEYVARLPASLKLKGGVTKYIFKKSMEPYLPREVLYRGKMGFGVPMRQWVTHELRDVVRGYLLDNSRVSGLLDPKLLRTMVEDNERNVYGSRYGGKLWWVLFFEMWYQDIHKRRQ
jgi:asparagine synthase (glutamine-hydrolysing)